MKFLRIEITLVNTNHKNKEYKSKTYGTNENNTK